MRNPHTKNGRVLIRCDGSAQIGAGHVMRMLALADALTEKKIEGVFCMRPLSETLQKKVITAGFSMITVPLDDKNQTADDFTVDSKAEIATLKTLVESKLQADPSEKNIPSILIVDHYGYEAPLLEACCRLFSAVVLVDDWMPERWVAPLTMIVNPNMGAPETFQQLSHAKALLGPQYALLRREFWPENHPKYAFHPDCKRLLLCFGASDTAGMTAKLLSLLSRVEGNFDITTVVGWEHPERKGVTAAAERCRHPVTLLAGVEDMVAAMMSQDLLILPSSTLSLEAAALGVPFTVVICEDNQRPAGNAMAQAGMTTLLGDISNWAEEAVLETLTAVLKDNSGRQKRAALSASAVCATGAKTVAAEIASLLF